MSLSQGAYNPSEHEGEILKKWMELKAYKPEFDPKTNTLLSEEEMKNDSRIPWTLICPPPNAYGRPHIGNISGYAYMDAMARYQRMNGKKVLVLPGKDHAGLEGEGVFVREVLEKQKRFKFDIPREDFYQEMMDWMQENMQKALQDEQEIGLSADFDRNTFTLDPDIVEVVLDTFVEMYEKGMIYKGVRIVNWDPKARTAVADNQIEYKESQTPFFYFKYNLVDQTKRLWNLSFYDVNVLNAILEGTKTVETRALNPDETDRYFGDIQNGDYINCVDKTTGNMHTFVAKDVRVYKDAKQYFEQEDLTKIWTIKLPNSYEEMIAQHDELAEDYGKKIEKNGIVAIELKPFTEQIDSEAVSFETQYKGKNIRFKALRNKTSKGDEDLPFMHGTTDEGIDIIGIGFSDNDIDSFVEGKVIGVYMSLARNYKLVVINVERGNEVETQDLASLQMQASLQEIFLFESRYYPGSHSILFDENSNAANYTNGFVIGTVRPETIFADTAIACDPKDERYKEFVGKKVKVSFLGQVKELNFIEDFAVDKDFGTGLLKVTPAHAVEDWEIAQRHPEECLPPIQVIDYDLRMNSLAGKYSGMKIKEAREAMREDMLAHGNLVFVDDAYENRIAIAERTKAPIEPLLSSQWYLKYDGIREAAIQMALNAHGDDSNLEMSREELETEIKKFDVSEGEDSYPRLIEKPDDMSVRIHPASMVLKFNNWMQNLRDWAISRSLWWGYRLPVWYHGEIKEEIGSDGMVRELIHLTPTPSQEGEKWIPLEYNNPNHMRVQKASPGEDWHQDENVLDTWFSSGQWVYATLKKFDLMDTFFPTDVLVSAYDILENWDSRMMMFTYFKEKNIPFKNLFLTGLVRASDGQKMSKSKGNVMYIDDLRAKYGTDAVRMVFYYQNSAGGDYAMTYEKLETFKRFINKMWNASKFVFMNLEGLDISANDIDSDKLNLPETKALFDHVISTKEHITKNINDYEFGLATYNLYQAFWHEFADLHIEAVKKYTYVQKDKETGEIISEPRAEDKLEAGKVLLFALKEYLKLLHPFIPFVTQRIWNEIPKEDGDHEILMYSRW